MSKHINVTIRYHNEKELYDLRVPTNLTTQQFVQTISKALKHELVSEEQYRIRILNKGFVLFDTQRVHEYPVSDGDEIEIF